jgi:hypothetical protein
MDSNEAGIAVATWSTVDIRKGALDGETSVQSENGNMDTVPHWYLILNI